MYSQIKKMRARLLVWLTHKMALPLLKLVRRPEKFPYDMDTLRSFPDGTLGKDLASFLEVKKLDLLPYYARHDIKHILLGYDTTEEGEGSLQCFMLGNGHLSFPVLATVGYCFLAMPEYWPQFKAAYQRGRGAASIRDWEWFELLPQSTAALEAKISL